ncbi:hypothetical protein ACQ4LE_009437 [Meloidogyne hapla]
MFFEKVVTFSGIYYAWFFNPFIGYREDLKNEFYSNIFFYHDLTVIILSPLIYLIFAIALFIKNQKYKQIINNSNNNSTNVFSITRLEKMVFIQVFTISLINTICCIICYYAIYKITKMDDYISTIFMKIFKVPADSFVLQRDQYFNATDELTKSF